MVTNKEKLSLKQHSSKVCILSTAAAKISLNSFLEENLEDRRVGKKAARNKYRKMGERLFGNRETSSAQT